MSKTNLTFSNGVAPAVNATNLNKLSGGVNDGNTYYDATGTNALTVSTSNGNYAYVDNVIINFKASNTNTGAMTINVDGQGIKNLLDEDGNVFGGGEIESGKFYTFVYDSTAGNFTYAPKGANPIKAWNNLNVIDNQLLSTQTLVSRLSVTGSGWIKNINAFLSTTNYIALKIDGVYLIGSATQGRLIRTSATNLSIRDIRFTTSFEIFSTVDSINCFYSLGDDYKKATAQYYTYQTAGTTPTLVTSVTGRGWIKSLDRNSGITSLVIDGTTVIDATGLTADMLINQYFESGFDYYNSTTSPEINYVLE